MVFLNDTSVLRRQQHHASHYLHWFGNLKNTKLIIPKSGKKGGKIPSFIVGA